MSKAAPQAEMEMPTLGEFAERARVLSALPRLLRGAR